MLGCVGDGLSYEDLVPHSQEMELGENLTVRVLGLEMLIRVKEEAGRDTDRAVLPILRRTLEEQNRL